MTVIPDSIGLNLPNLRETELFHYIRDELGVPVTRGRIKRAVMNREIRPTRIGKANLFSRQDALNWLTAQQESA